MPIDQLLKSDTARNTLSGFLGGAAGGALVSAISSKKSAKKLLKAGGLVALGGIAWSAVQKYREQTNTPVDLPEASPRPQTTPRDGLLLLRAMISAAYADGHLNDAEQSRIWQRAIDEGLSGAALSELEHLLMKPPTMMEIAQDTTDLESRLEVYGASVMAIDEHCAAGRIYLEDLAVALRLPTPLVAAVHRRISAPEADQLPASR